MLSSAVTEPLSLRIVSYLSFLERIVSDLTLTHVLKVARCVLGEVHHQASGLALAVWILPSNYLGTLSLLVRCQLLLRCERARLQHIVVSRHCTETASEITPTP